MDVPHLTMSADISDNPPQGSALPSAVAAPSPPPPAPAARWLAPTALIISAGLFLYGLAGGLLLRMLGAANAKDKAPEMGFYLYATMEPVVMFGLLALCVLMAVFIDNKTRVPEMWPGGDGTSALLRRVVWLVLPVLVLAAGVAGTLRVMHEYPFAPEEYAITYQAKTRAGEAPRGLAPVPLELAWLGNAARPSFVTQYGQVLEKRSGVNEGGDVFWRAETWRTPPAGARWDIGWLESGSAYVTLRAITLVLDLSWIVNPLLSALCVVMAALLARRLWPDRTFAQAELPAAALMAASTQLLVTGMSAHAGPAALLCNMLWLWLFLRGDTLGYVLAAVAAWAAVWFSPWPMLFLPVALPFLLRLALRRQWARLSGNAAALAAVAAHWLYVTQSQRGTVFGDLGTLVPVFVAGPGVTPLFPATAGGAQPLDVVLSSLSVPLFFAWQALPVTVLALAALLSWRRLEEPVRDIAAGLGLALAAVAVLFVSTGFAWGNGYAHGVMGSAVLLAAAGWPAFQESAGKGRAGLFLVLGLAVAVGGQLPWRAYCAEQTVRPFVQASQLVDIQHERFQLIDPNYLWYGDMVLRNGPFLAENGRPVMLRTPALQTINRDNYAVVLDALKQLGPSKIIKVDHLVSLGIPSLSEDALRHLGVLNRDGTNPDLPRNTGSPR